MRGQDGRRCYFYSRPRAGGDFLINVKILRVNIISTHAPARGATTPPDLGEAVHAISTHAPAWGATEELQATVGGYIEFLLTPPRGERHPFVYNECHYDKFLLTPQNRGRTHRRGTPQAETGV